MKRLKCSGVIGYAILYLLCSGCSGRLGLDSSAPASRASEIEFIVASSTDLEAIKDVDLIIVSRTGHIQNVGRTSELGRVSVPKARLRSAQVLLFCRDGYFCGAFQLYRRDAEYFEYNELFITLAPFSLL